MVVICIGILVAACCLATTSSAPEEEWAEIERPNNIRLVDFCNSTELKEKLEKDLYFHCPGTSRFIRRGLVGDGLGQCEHWEEECACPCLMNSKQES